MPFEVILTPEQIEELYDKAMERGTNSKFPGLTYEQGVSATIDYLIGRAGDSPMED